MKFKLVAQPLNYDRINLFLKRKITNFNINTGFFFMSSTAVLLTGSNIGNRTLYLEQAINAIAEKAGKIIATSHIYESAAWGKTDQQDFLNQAIVIETGLSPQALLSTIQEIENEAGRKRTETWGARTLDIDILFYDNLIVDSENLTIPHPYIQERLFTLAPLNEILPELMHPALNKSMAELYAACDKSLNAYPYINAL
jgi:2-amino-4-hydroxy-6-hydroxymethyldihydropteridine diphosphokinase